MTGSPPHTRGILREDIRDAENVGFTPAYAGNTIADSRSYGVKEVHPRIRGEYRRPDVRRHAGGGSPPHTRGIPVVDNAEQIRRRFTPAYAGNTC